MTTNTRQKRFLTAYRRSGKVATSARDAGVHRDTIYAWRRTDPAFVQAMADIDAQREQKRRQEAREREADTERRAEFARRREYLYRLRRMMWAEGWAV